VLNAICWGPQSLSLGGANYLAPALVKACGRISFRAVVLRLQPISMYCVIQETLAMHKVSVLTS